MLQSPNSMVILAGGLGKRIQHIANGQPKILLPILGNPFIEYQLQWFQSQGIQDVLLILSFGADQVVNYLKARPPTPGLKVRWVIEPEPQGTGGALQFAFQQNALPAQFFLTYGDSYLPVPFAPLCARFQSSKKRVLMTVFRNYGQFDRSNVQLFANGEIRYLKSANNGPQFDHIDYGLMVMDRRFVEEEISPKGPVDLAEPLSRLSDRGDLAAAIMDQRFFEVGSEQGIADFAQWLKKASANDQAKEVNHS